MQRLRIGIVGCGEVTQIIHLPTLYQLGDLFTVTALCDVSESVLAGMGKAWGIATRLLDFEDLIALDTVDAVLLANPNVYHAPMTIAALQAGKHVLVEKPMCLTVADNDAIIAAQRDAGKIVQVGTMRRYAPAFIEACRLVKALPEIRLAKVHDIIGSNSLVIEPTSRVIRGEDIPGAISESMREQEAAAIRLAIGDQPEALQRAYKMLLGLSTHDISAMREMLGAPRRVLHGAQRSQGRYLSAVFDYGDFLCHFTTGGDSLPRYDTWLAVYGAERVIRVDYDTPYVRNLPIRLSVLETTDGRNVIRRVAQPGWGDAFVEEWRAFHHSCLSGQPAKTSPEDFREDLVIFASMIALMADESG